MSQSGTPELPYGAAMSRERSERVKRQMMSLYREKQRDEDEETFLRKAAQTQYHRLLDRIAIAAEDHAVAQNQSPAQFGSALLNDALNVCDDIRRALTPARAAESPLLVWRPVGQARHFVKDEQFPTIDREALRHAVDRYLRLPIRQEMVDRILADALIAAELLDCRRAILATLPKSSSVPLLSRLDLPRAFGGSRVGLASSFLLLCGAGAIVLYLGHRGTMDAGWSAGIGLSLIGLFLIAAAVQIMAWKRSRTRDLSFDLIDAAYRELQADGSASVSRLYDLANDAAKAGVSWPPSLFALLDDVKLRSAKL